MSNRLPSPDIIIPIKVIPVVIREMLDYCAHRALEEIGGVAYDCDNDTVIYHHVIDNQDDTLFPELMGTREIWVLQSGINLGRA